MRHGLLGCLLGLLAGLVQAAPFQVQDARGQAVMLERPAQRIVSLAPHLTELLFSAGAGARIVGAVAFSDYPAAARRIPRVGDAFRLDLERILALAPDLVVAWKSGIKAADLERLAAAGIPVYVAASADLASIAGELEDLGRLAGQAEEAARAASRYRERLAELTATFGGRSPVTVFYQVWDRPLMTVSDRHVIGEVLRRCGGRNPFGTLQAPTPTIDAEALLAADPQVMLTAAAGDGVDPWRRWRDQTALQAVRAGRLHVIPGDWISRPALRILKGMERICRLLDAARGAGRSRGPNQHPDQASG